MAHTLVKENIEYNELSIYHSILCNSTRAQITTSKVIKYELEVGAICKKDVSNCIK